MKNTRTKKQYVFILLFLSIAALIRPAAFSFQPLRVDFSPSGKGSIQTFQISNDSEEPIAVAISMLTRSIDKYGEETNKDASSMFAVFPKQALLQAGASQAIRVQWKGPSRVRTERAFRIKAEQLPIRFDRNRQSGGGSINILLRYLGSVYVVPENEMHDITVTNTAAVSTDDDEKKLAIDVVNEGTVHVILQELRIQLSASNGDGLRETVTLEGEAVKGMSGENMLAGSKRRFLLPWPSGVGENNIDVELFFNPVR